MKKKHEEKSGSFLKLAVARSDFWKVVSVKLFIVGSNAMGVYSYAKPTTTNNKNNDIEFKEKDNLIV